MSAVATARSAPVPMARGTLSRQLVVRTTAMVAAIAVALTLLTAITTWGVLQRQLDDQIEAVRDAIAEAITTLPERLRRSLAWDQGAEMARHADLRIDHGLPVYFCDPQSPWQRGTNENTNGLLRQYFPKGTDLSLHGPDVLISTRN